MHTDLRFGLEHGNVAARQREGPPDGETRNTSPYDNAVETFSHIDLAHTVRRDANTSRAPKFCAKSIRFRDCDSPIGFHDPRCFFAITARAQDVCSDRIIGDSKFVAICPQSPTCK